MMLRNIYGVMAALFLSGGGGAGGGGGGRGGRTAGGSGTRSQKRGGGRKENVRISTPMGMQNAKMTKSEQRAYKKQGGEVIKRTRTAQKRGWLK